MKTHRIDAQLDAATVATAHEAVTRWRRAQQAWTRAKAEHRPLTTTEQQALTDSVTECAVHLETLLEQVPRP